MIESKKIHNLITKHIVPARIICEVGCTNSEAILGETPRQAILFGEKKSLCIKKNGYIILDFGKELQGGISITIPAVEKDTHIRIVFGESVSEAMSSIGYKNATNDHAIRDTVVPVTSWQTFRFGNTGFRFVKLETVDNDVTVSGVQAAFEYRDIEYMGSFECSDKLLNKIWITGAYTVQLNMQEYLWDGIKRDRLVWVGDMHPEISTILAVFGDNEVIKNSLDMISSNTPADKWMNGMPSYNLWWLIIQLDYYMWTGDFEYLEAQEEYLCSMCKHILLLINGDGTHNIRNIFVEWSSRDTKYEKAGFQAMLALGLNAAS